MAYGLYTAPERVERDGRLVCFAGEVMTKEEAARRGLLDAKGKPVSQPAPEPAPAAPAPGAEDRVAELSSMKRADLVALAAEVGAGHAKDANRETIAQAIAAAEAEQR